MLFLGIDAGTERVKTALLKDDAVAAAKVSQIGKDSVFCAIDRCLCEMQQELAIARHDIAAAGITGASAGYADLDSMPFLFQKYRISSATAWGTAMLAPDVRTVIDIGADSYAVIKCKEGHVLKVERNNSCASGTGGYLVRVGKILGIDILQDHATVAVEGDIPIVSSTCAVFAETEIISLIHHKERPQNILIGVYKGIAEKINSHIASIDAEREFAVVGGVSNNRELIKYLEKSSNTSFVDIPFAENVTAVGVARLAGREWKAAL